MFLSIKSFLITTSCSGPGAGWKLFPDMRQNEREIKFIRARDAVKTAGPLKGEPTLNRGP